MLNLLYGPQPIKRNQKYLHIITLTLYQNNSYTATQGNDNINGIPGSLIAGFQLKRYYVLAKDHYLQNKKSQMIPLIYLISICRKHARKLIVFERDQNIQVINLLELILLFICLWCITIFQLYFEGKNRSTQRKAPTYQTSSHNV